MITNGLDPPKLKSWIDENVKDNLLREILDDWNWQKDPPNVVIEDEKILGFCASKEYQGFYKCCYFFMHPDYRGKGYGKKLLELSFCEAKRRNLPYLYVSEERFDGWKIFKNHGFPFTIKEANGLKDYYFIVDTSNRSQLFLKEE